MIVLADISSNNMMIREWINGCLFPLASCLSALIAVFLYDAWSQERDFNKIPGARTASALWWVFTSAAAWTGTVWFALRLKNHGRVAPPTLQQFFEVGWLMTGIILVFAIVYCIYLFTPPRYGHKVWIGAVLSTAAFLAASAILSSFGY
jgi:hypothetical protein